MPTEQGTYTCRYCEEAVDSSDDESVSYHATKCAGGDPFGERILNYLDGNLAATEPDTVPLISPQFNLLLYIVPKGRASKEPIIDRYTRRMAAALHQASSEGLPRWRGLHICVCGAMSANHDFRLPSGKITNSLCVHYLAHHRKEVSEEELRRVIEEPVGEMEPTPEILLSPS